MPLDPPHTLALAGSLLANMPEGQDRETVLRCAIGRAYYAAYRHALSYASDFLGYSAKGFGDDHGALREHLKRSKRWEVAKRLDSLRSARNAADYDAAPIPDYEVATVQAIKDAEYVLKALIPPKPKQPPVAP
jgi:hypothetical protein